MYLCRLDYGGVIGGTVSRGRYQQTQSFQTWYRTLSNKTHRCRIFGSMGFFLPLMVDGC